MEENKIKDRMKLLDEVMNKIKEYPIDLQKQAFDFLIKGNDSKVDKEETKILKNKNKNSGASGVYLQLIEMIDEGFFNSPKYMREILEKLSERGFNIAANYISPRLLNLVKNKKLIRHRDKEGKFVYYIQKSQKSGGDSK